MIYNQIVTWTAFAILAMFLIARTFFRPRTKYIAGDEEAGRTRGEGGIGGAVG